jgi:glutathione S-transferase
MMRLYHGGPTGYSASVLIALAEKGLAFESRRIDLAALEQHGTAFLAVNPTGQVPVLEAEGHRLTETFFILLYLDERFPEPPMGGTDERSRYATQKWGKYVETHLAPSLAVVAWSMRGTNPDASARAGFARLTPERRLLWQQASDGFNDTEVEAARTAVAKAIDRVEEDLADGRWLAGRDYGVADIIAFPHVGRARELGFEIPPSVADWLNRIAARPAVIEALAESPRDDAFATMGPERGRWG